MITQWGGGCEARSSPRAGGDRQGSLPPRRPLFLRLAAWSQRNTVERCIRLKQWRGLATRYEKTTTIYLAGLHIAGIFFWSAR